MDLSVYQSEKFEENEELKLAFHFVQYTHRNLFLTGNAGTGKTTFLRNLKEKSFKRMVIVAPTGVAAINAGGVTIHSFFQLPFGPIVPVDYRNIDEFSQLPVSRLSANTQKINRQKIAIIKSLDLLVIDEISMVRADLLDGIDEVLRRYKNRNKPFGGVQLLMIGDMHQLAPVVKDDEWEILRNHYNTVFFFSSKALQETDYVSIELKHIFRQSDRNFISLLNKVRKNDIDQELLAELNERYIYNVEKEGREGYIILTTHNAKAKEINDFRLNELNEKSHKFKAEIKGDFPEYSYPTEYELELKVGAQVMFVKNDSSPLKRYYNGKIGKIVEFDEETILIECEDEDDLIDCGKEVWENIRYEIDDESKEIKEDVIGKFVQYPLKLAWAITIHKSQGLTFEKAIIDARAAFAYGQVYVALSRCRSLEGLILSSKISFSSIKTNQSIISFADELEEKLPDLNILEDSKKAFQEMLIKELFDFSFFVKRISYLSNLLRDNITVVPQELFDVIMKVYELLKTEIIGVADKFYPQLEQMFANKELPEHNEFLQTRIKKASAYFLEKTESILKNNFAELDIDIDNKAIRKTVSDIITKITDELNVKLACLHECTNGFNTIKFLDIRAKASIEKVEIKPGFKKQKEIGQRNHEHPKLYSMLRSWRNIKAEEQDVPVYMVLPQKTMSEISMSLPASIKELKKIHGMGVKKLQKYGEEIFSIITAYRKEINLDSDDYEMFEKEVKVKKVRGGSALLSFELFKSGKSINEIANERGMSPVTIEGHLTMFVKEGKLKIEEIVSPEKVYFISEWFLKMKDLSLTNAKNALGEGVSYGELKMVLSHLEFEGKIQKSN